MSRAITKIKKCAVCSALSRQRVLASVCLTGKGQSGKASEKEKAERNLFLQRCPRCGYESCNIGRVCTESLKKAPS